MKTKTKKIPTQWFIDFYKKIPDSKWTEYTLTDKRGRHCALGLLNSEGKGPKCEAIQALTAQIDTNIASVNDAGNTLRRFGGVDTTIYSEVFGTTPKERVLTFLYNLKGMGITA